MLLIKSKAFSFFLCMIVILPFSCSSSCTFTITNNCPNTIWPGTLAGSGTPQLSTTGFRLEPEQSVRLGSISGWSGRIWARTGCTFNEFGVGKCQTGDCGGKLECIGNGATPPASLFEITLGKGNDKDFYDISLVDGYNLPLLATPHPSFGACNATGCISDVNMGCPKELQVVGEGRKGEGGVIACKSACEAFGLDHYCCSGEFGNPTTCKPSYYSTIFKRACPTAYSYAYDDGTSTFTCKAYDYTIVFCPNLNGMKKPVSNLTPPTTQEPSMSTPPVMPTTLTPPAIQQPFTSPPATQQLTLTHPPATPQPSTLTPPTTQQPSTLMPPPAIQQPSTLTPPPATPQPSTLTPPLATQQPSTMTPPPTTQVPSTSTPSTVREPTIEGTSALASYSTKLLPLQLWIILLVINIITFTY